MVDCFKVFTSLSVFLFFVPLIFSSSSYKINDVNTIIGISNHLRIYSGLEVQLPASTSLEPFQISINNELVASLVHITLTLENGVVIFPIKRESDSAGSCENFFFDLNNQDPTNSGTLKIALTILLGNPAIPAHDIVSYNEEPAYIFRIPMTLLLPYPVKNQVTKFEFRDCKATISPSYLVESNGGLIFTSSNVPSMNNQIETFKVINRNNRFHVYNYSRTIQLSYKDVFVTEKIDLKNFGPSLSSEFNRIKYTHNGQRNTHSAIRSMSFRLPNDSYDVTYRDEVGLISTSSFSTHDGITYFNCIPRFPIFGEWNSSFEIHYKYPIAGKLKKSGDGSYLFKMPIAQLFLDAFISNFKIFVIVPETARVVNHNFNRSGFASSLLSERFNLGIFNSQVIEINSQNLIDDLLRDDLQIELEYFMLYSLFMKCFFVFLVFQIIFAIFICYKMSSSIISKLTIKKQIIVTGKID